jgi:N-methylhydantoinase A
VRERFDTRHAQLHGHAAKERPVEVVSYRLRARVPVPKYEPKEDIPVRSRDAGLKGTRAIAFDGRPIEAALYERDRLDVGAVIATPAIVEQFDATTVIPPGWRARVDGYRNLIMTRD